MIEYKFMAWDKLRRRMSEPFMLGELPLFKSSGRLADYQRPIEKHLIEVMQYTGLHDKNGREIYDGDILLKDGGFIRVVRHEPPLFYTVPIDKWSIEHNIKERVIFPSTFLDSEVIGNIYENPELLGKNF